MAKCEKCGTGIIMPMKVSGGKLEEWLAKQGYMLVKVDEKCPFCENKIEEGKGRWVCNPCIKRSSWLKNPRIKEKKS